MKERQMYGRLKDKKVEAVSSNELLEFAKEMEQIDNRVVAQDTLKDGVLVSTVFLGINHGWGERPMWFETMIFGGEHDGYQERYETYEQAEEGHKRALKLFSWGASLSRDKQRVRSQHGAGRGKQVELAT